MVKSDAAMTHMMAAMEIKPSGNVDRDFVAMMVPHHQGAIDMAQAELRDGHNERLRSLAQEIIVTQQEEIAEMQLALASAATSLGFAVIQLDVSVVNVAIKPLGAALIMAAETPRDRARARLPLFHA